MPPQSLLDSSRQFLFGSLSSATSKSTDVGGHDHNGVLKIDNPALAVGQASIVK
jgi:hypothetical protein